MVEPIPVSSSLFVYSLVPCIFFFFYAIGGSVLLDLFDDGVCPWEVKAFLVASIGLTYLYLAFYFSVILKPIVIPYIMPFHKKWYKVFIYCVLNILFLVYMGSGIAFALLVNDQSYSAALPNDSCRSHAYYKMAAVSIALFAFYFFHQLLIFLISSLRLAFFCCFNSSEEERLASELEMKWALQREKERELEKEWQDRAIEQSLEAETELERIEREIKEKEKEETREANLTKRMEERKKNEMESEEKEEKESEFLGRGKKGKGKTVNNRKESISVIQPTRQIEEIGATEEEFDMDKDIDGADNEEAKRPAKAPGSVPSPSNLKELEEILAPLSPQLNIDLKAIFERERERILAEDRASKVEQLRRERAARERAKLNDQEAQKLKEIALERQAEIERLRKEREMRKLGKDPLEIKRMDGSQKVYYPNPQGDYLFAIGGGDDGEFGIPDSSSMTQNNEQTENQYAGKNKKGGLRSSAAPGLDDDADANNDFLAADEKKPFDIAGDDDLMEGSAGDWLLASQESQDTLIGEKLAELAPKSKKSSKNKGSGSGNVERALEDEFGIESANPVQSAPMQEDELEGKYNDADTGINPLDAMDDPMLAQPEKKKKKKKSKSAEAELDADFPAAGNDAFSLDSEPTDLNAEPQGDALASIEDGNLDFEAEKPKKKKKSKAKQENPLDEANPLGNEENTGFSLDAEPFAADASLDIAVEEEKPKKKKSNKVESDDQMMNNDKGSEAFDLDSDAAAAFDMDSEVKSESAQDIPAKKEKKLLEVDSGDAADLLADQPKQENKEKEKEKTPRSSPLTSPSKSSLRSPLKPRGNSSRNVGFNLEDEKSTEKPSEPEPEQKSKPKAEKDDSVEIEEDYSQDDFITDEKKKDKDNKSRAADADTEVEIEEEAAEPSKKENSTSKAGDSASGEFEL